MRTIAAAAWKHPVTGKVFTGQMHADCWFEAMIDDSEWEDKEAFHADWASWMMEKMGIDNFYDCEGFVDNDGKFLDRKAARIVADKSKQVKKSADRDEYLLAEDIRRFSKCTS